MARPAPGRWVLTCVLVALGAAAAFGLVSTAGADDHHTVEPGVTVAIVDGATLRADVYVPEKERANHAAVLVVHGGGWVGGDRADVADAAGALADDGYLAVAIDYRLAPEVQYQSQLDDLVTALSWVAAPEQAARYAVEPARIGALGMSAGGHLATLLGQTDDRLGAVVSWSGLYDLRTARLDSRVLGCSPKECPDIAADASPISHVTATDAPVFLVSSGSDPIIGPEQVDGMGTVLEAAGASYATYVVEGDEHAYQLQEVVWPETLSWFERHLLDA